MADRDSIHLNTLQTGTADAGSPDYDEKKISSNDDSSEKKDLDGYGGDGKTRVLVTDASDVYGREKEVEELEERLAAGEATNDEYRVEGVSEFIFEYLSLTGVDSGGLGEIHEPSGGPEVQKMIADKE
jgi:hypothetical protein